MIYFVAGFFWLWEIYKLYLSRRALYILVGKTMSQNELDLIADWQERWSKVINSSPPQSSKIVKNLFLYFGYLKLVSYIILSLKFLFPIGVLLIPAILYELYMLYYVFRYGVDKTIEMWSRTQTTFLDAFLIIVTKFPLLAVLTFLLFGT